MSIPVRASMLAVVVATWFSIGMMELAADDKTDEDAVDWTAKAKEAWHHTCAKCHTVPDTTFETDRAFLRQVTETS